MVFCGVVPTGSGVPVFEEYSFGGSTFPLAVLFRRRSRPPVLPAARVEGREAVIAVVANSLRAGGGWSPVHPDPGHWMQEVGDADTLRRFISLIRRVVVLGRGGSGNWLLGAGDALEWLHRLVLARARSFLIDVYPPGRTRPEYLRDFRQAVEIADGSTDRSAVGVAVEISFGRAIGVPDGSSGSSRVAMVAGPSGGFTPDVVRRSVAQRQLFGLMCDAREAAHLRRQLESWVGFRHRESLEIDINVAVDYVQSASWLPREEAGLVAYEPLFAAWKLIAGDRLVRHDVEPDAWKVAAEALVRRRRKLFPPLKSAPSGGSTGMWIETAFPLLAGQRQNAIPVEQGSGRGRHD
jgi:hypothetical protein